MPLRILVVEDHAPFRRFTCAALRRREGFEIIEAADGLEAVRKIEELQPDLILLDINLPGTHGFEVAKQIPRLAPRARLIFMSQESSADIVKQALSLGARGYIQKVSAATDLLPAVEAVLAGHEFVSRSVALTEPIDPGPHPTGGETPVTNDLERAIEIRSQYAAIVESSNDAIIAKNLNGVISAWNGAAERMFGYTEREAIGQPIAMIIPPDLYDEERDMLSRLRAGERVHRETVRITKAGERIDVSLTISPLRDASGRITGCSKIARDITEAKLAQAARSSLNQKLIEAHEEERARIARELHDDINQRLALVSVRLGYLKQGLPASAIDLEPELGAVREEIQSIVGDIQALSHGLHPAKLDLLGLEKAAAGFCNELSDRHGVAIDVRFENIPKTLPREISLCLYRVLQEALMNVVKHSVSRHARVSLSGQQDTITLTVEDSGGGFDPHDAMTGRGLGLTSMKERLKVVGGELSIYTEQGRGTTIHAVAPLCLPSKPPTAVR